MILPGTSTSPAAAPSVLVVVASDPQTSGRPAEAVRIAAGLAGWRRVRTTLCLCGPAALALDARRDDLVAAPELARHLPSLRESGGRILVLGANVRLPDRTDLLAGFQRVEVGELARLAAGQGSVLRF